MEDFSAHPTKPANLTFCAQSNWLSLNPKPPMKTLVPSLRQLFLATVLPAALAFSACGDDDDDTPAPQQGKVLLVHSAPVNSGQVTAFINDQQVGQLNYGTASAYLNVNAGTPSLRLNSGTSVLVTQALTIAANQNYSAFAYSPTATIGSAPAVLTVTDDLTAPAAGQAKIRVVHLAVNAPTPVRLTLPSPLPGTPGTDLTPDVAFGAASGFVAINPGSYNLSITAGGTTRTQVRAVGDGSGTGTGSKTFEAGKIYTVVVQGIAGVGVQPPTQDRAIIVANN
jgi:Domain of unknown function (DUF4397)